jgi:S-DNA-T family DNA segregation ATPase FtsK/SpoIIIE
MAKRKANKRGNIRGKPWWLRLLRFFFVPPGLFFTFIVIVAAIAWWRWGDISGWADNTFRFFGFGLVFIILAIITVIWVFWKKKPSSFIHHWNRWLGSIVFILALWGILAFIPAKGVLSGVSLGGRLGQGIIIDTNYIGILRVFGLIILGIIFVAPGASFRLVKKSISWLINQFKKIRLRRIAVKKFQPSPSAQESLRPSKTTQAAATSELIGKKPEEKSVPLISAPVPTPQELKQVAQDVWKKYGESPDLVIVDGWKLPPIDILDASPEIQFSQADNAERAKLIEEALASYGVEARVVQINAGPTVTQFGVEPGWDRKTREVREKDRDGNVKLRLEEVSKTRVKVERINSLSNDLALALAASSIRIEAPVPGKSVVGIEVPNTISSVVSLRGVIETNVFQKIQARSRLAIALGKGAGGEAVSGDLAKMPHLLIAGATGSGKTVCLNAIICCLIMNNTPNDVRFILIDPKRVELTTFNSIPHLATPVIVDAEKAIDALRWLSQEMNNRYQILASAGSRNIESYNKNRQGAEKMHYLVLVIDELADLMMVGGDEVEQTLCRLAQLARAIGIHLVVATQRPSVDVVTGLIKANFPTRISFAVTSQVDSRTILDIGGAEKLLGSGDMLYMPTEAAKPKRLQGCYVSDTEAERLVYFWGNQRKEQESSLKIEELTASLASTRKTSYPEDSLMEAARQLAKEHPHISASYLQRKLRIGYPRAARIMEQLEEEGGKGEGREGSD